jgi:nucleotide-binding universal stress UspA family protein
VVVVPEAVPVQNVVVVAFDGSPPAVRALQAFEASGLAKGQEVHVICAGPDRCGIESRVGRAVEYLALHGIEAKACPVLTSAAPCRVLAKQVQQLNAGLLVMGAFGRSRFRELLCGSLTRTMLTTSPVPLFLCH